MERQLRCQRLDDRRKRCATCGLAVAFGLLRGGHLFETGLNDRKAVGRPADDDAATPVAHPRDDAQRCRQFGDDLVDLLRTYVRDAQHRVAEQSTTATDDLRRRTDEARDGEQLDIVDAGERLGGELTLRVADDSRRLESPGCRCPDDATRGSRRAASGGCPATRHPACQACRHRAAQVRRHPRQTPPPRARRPMPSA